MKRIATTTLALLLFLGLAVQASAHCQVPCGIYGDELRVQLMEEDITTVEKAMKEIVAIGTADSPNYNQLVRWVVNKEEHAQKIMDTVTAYFMAQRIKWPGDSADEKAQNEYLHKLALLHQIQVHAMKSKQGTDLDEIAALRDLVAKFRTAYFGDEGMHEH